MSLLMRLALIIPMASPMAAGQIYRWVDDQGNVHFSDQPPSSPSVSVQVQPMPSTAPASQPDEMPYSVMNQVKRLQAEREQREAARRAEQLQRLEEARRLADIDAAEAQARQAEMQAERARQPVYFVYPGFHRHPRHREDEPPAPPPRKDHQPDRRDERSLTTPGLSLPSVN